MQSSGNNGNIHKTKRKTINQVTSADFGNSNVWHGEGKNKVKFKIKPNQSSLSYTFAGNGARTSLRIANFLVSKYGGQPTDWSHESVDFELLDKNGDSKGIAEVHYFYNGKKRFNLKVKRWRE